MQHPEAVIEKAKQIEHLLSRVERGESIELVRAELGLDVKIEDLPKLQARYEAGGRCFEALIDGRYGHWQTVNTAVREWLYERKQQAEELRAPQLADEMEKMFGVRVAAGHINYLLRKRGQTHSVGRPRLRSQTDPPQAPQELSDQLVENVGLFFPGSSQAGDEDHGSRREPD